MANGLTDRKKKILQALVDGYIVSAEPVSSADIRNNYVPDVSTATIRNELAELEEMGYVAQPHTSAGRVPLPAAYKFYVDNMLTDRPLSQDEISIIEQQFAGCLSEVEDLTRRAVKIISDITNYTSFAVLKESDEISVKEVKLVEMDEYSALLLVITDKGVLSDKFVELGGGIRGEQITAANRVLNNIFAGKKLSEVNANDDLINFELQEYRDLYEKVLNLIKSACGNGEKVYVEGALKVLDFPEYSNMQDAKKFLTAVSNKDNLSALVEKNDNIEFGIKIGKDDGLDNCAVVTVKYTVNGTSGQAGVIGPERMDYGKVVSVLNYLADALKKPTDN